MTLYTYIIEFKAIVQLCEALGLRVSATEAAAKVAAEEDGIDMSNPSNANKWKYNIDKSEVHFQATMHFNGLNKIIYNGLKSEVKNNCSVQGVNNFPKNIIETIMKADTFIDPKTGVKSSDSQGLAFMQQGEKYSDKGGKGRGGAGCGQGGRGQYTSKQYGGGKTYISNTKPGLKMVATNLVRHTIY